MTATTYVVGNFKGGVGKTKIVSMLAYDNAIINQKKTLVVDMDPQGNASQVLARTGGLDGYEKTILDGIAENDFSNCITKIKPTLDIIPCDTGFRAFVKYVIKNFDTEEEQISVIKNLLDPLKEHYETIYIDVPPTISEYSDNAMAAADYSIIAFQTQEESYEGVGTYIGYQKFMAEKFGIDLQVIAIVACMLKSDSRIDTGILSDAKNEYGTNVLDTIINYQERLKSYSSTGIHLKRNKNGKYDQWDHKAHEVFLNILEEIKLREEYYLKIKGGN